MVEEVQVEAPPLNGPVLMNQDWRDLTYLHWAVEPDRVAHLMPHGVRPDVQDGLTYVGLVPFRMVDAGLGRRSRVPWLGTFLETNVRLYSVDARGRRGVVFLSLDADRLAVVLAARVGFRVPYRWAAMAHQVTGPAESPTHVYRSRLRGHHASVDSTIAVRVGARRDTSSLDDFVSARWRLHTQVLGRAVLVPNAHERWTLHDVELVDLDDGGLFASVGLPELAERAPDHLAFSPGVHARFGLPRPA